MAGNSNIEQFLLELGFKDSGAFAALKKLAKLTDKLQKQQSKTSDKQKKALKDETALLKSKNALQRKILQAEKEGLNVKSFKSTLANAKKLETIKKRTAELDQFILSNKGKVEKVDNIKIDKAKQLKEIEDKKFRNFKEEVELEKAFDHVRAKEAAKAEKLKQERHNQAVKKLKERARLHEKLARIDSTFDNNPTLLRLRESNPQRAADLKKQMRQGVREGGAEGVRMTLAAKAAVNALEKEYKSATRAAKGLQRVQRGISDSTVNMIRSYVSLFALLEGTIAIKNTGQQLEAMQAGMMLTANNTKEMGENLAFVRAESRRLGLGLAESSKGFVKLASAGLGKLEQSDIQTLFTGITEAATVSQLSMDDTNGAIRAVTQMMSKGKISAEEYRLQLAERMPLAARAMEKATGLTSAELSKQLELGNLMSEDVLPKFGKALRDVVAESGALESALKTNLTAQKRLMAEFAFSAETIFEGGFGSALTEIFNDLRDQLQGSEKGLEGMGKIFRVVFNIINSSLKILIPVVDSLFFSLGKVFDLFSGERISTVLVGLTALAIAARPLALIITGIVIAIDELFSLFESGRIGLIEKALSGLVSFFTGKDLTTDLNLSNISVFDLEKNRDILNTVPNQKGNNTYVDNKTYNVNTNSLAVAEKIAPQINENNFMGAYSGFGG